MIVANSDLQQNFEATHEPNDVPPLHSESPTCEGGKLNPVIKLVCPVAFVCVTHLTAHVSWICDGGLWATPGVFLSPGLSKKILHELADGVASCYCFVGTTCQVALIARRSNIMFERKIKKQSFLTKV